MSLRSSPPSGSTRKHGTFNATVAAGATGVITDFAAESGEILHVQSMSISTDGAADFTILENASREIFVEGQLPAAGSNFIYDFTEGGVALSAIDESLVISSVTGAVFGITITGYSLKNIVGKAPVIGGV